MGRLWGKNYADAVRKDLDIADSEVKRLETALAKGDEAFRNEVWKAASSGLWQAVGQTDFEHLTNRNWDLTHRASEPTAPPVKLWDWIGKDL